jgi:alcohol dehydrogenase
VDSYVNALVLEAPRTLQRRQFPKPTIGHGDVLVSVLACGICGTDHEMWSGVQTSPYPLVPGHETVGRVEEIDEEARQRWGVDVGDVVAIEPVISCLECKECRSDRRTACENGRSILGMTQSENGEPLVGGYAEMQYIPRGAFLHKVPSHVAPRDASAINAVANAWSWTVRLPKTKPGDLVAVLGAGPRGLMCAAIAKHVGAAATMITGFGTRDAPRLSAARSLGVDLVVDAAACDPVEAFLATFGRRADVVVDSTANSAQAFLQALDLAGEEAVVTIAGLRGRVTLEGFEPDHFVNRGITIRGGNGAISQDYAHGIDFLASSDGLLDHLPLEAASFDGLDDLLARLANVRPGSVPVRAAFVP